MITRAEWSDEADAGLSRALPDATIRGIVAAEVKRGRSKLWLCKTDAHKAWAVTRLDSDPAEWVVVAFEGSGMMTFGPQFIAIAKANNIPLRAHVTSPLVEKLFSRLGMVRQEAIWRTAA
jgi:hypothetical protein